MNNSSKIIILIFSFILFIAVFTVIYTYYNDLSMQDALHVALSYQTFAGFSIPEDNIKMKNVASLQMFLAYTFIIIIIYTILQ